jgi:hypothetical protein
MFYRQSQGTDIPSSTVKPCYCFALTLGHYLRALVRPPTGPLPTV